MTAPPRVLAEAGFCNPKDLPRGPNGRALCRWCNNEVPPPKQSFCSDACVHEWKLRSNPGYARRKVFERDKGVCALCGTHCGGEQRVPGGRLHRAGGWDMDHVIPVAEGGGSCGLEGLRTLCKPCHRSVTAALKRRLAERRRAARGAEGFSNEGVKSHV